MHTLKKTNNCVNAEQSILKHARNFELNSISNKNFLRYLSTISLSIISIVGYFLQGKKIIYSSVKLTIQV